MSASSLPMDGVVQPLSVSRRRLAFSLVLAVTLVASMIFTVLPPILPALAEHFGGGQKGEFAAQLGLMTPSIGWLLGAAVVGWVMPRVGIRATVGAIYRVNAKLAVRGDAGLGVLLLRGLGAGNALTDDAAAGAFTMPSLRVGVAAEYAVTRNLVATVAPIGVGFSPASDRLAFRSLTQLDVLVGLGYRM